ncbi:MAG TPA: dodecin family protein [Balneolaceae bacterium]|nr:dodecin family protein [Balneolaceae bacterium]
MSLAKNIEVIAEGETIEQAFENAVSEASETVSSIKQVWADNIRAVVENNKITSYRIDAKITFEVKKKAK